MWRTFLNNNKEGQRVIRVYSHVDDMLSTCHSFVFVSFLFIEGTNIILLGSYGWQFPRLNNRPEKGWVYSFSFFSLFPNDFNFQMELFPDGSLFLVYLRTYSHGVALITNIRNSVFPKLETIEQDVLQHEQITKQSIYIIVMMVLAFLAPIQRHHREFNYQHRKKRLKNPIILTW